MNDLVGWNSPVQLPKLKCSPRLIVSTISGVEHLRARLFVPFGKFLSN